jgi:hypothetical protein
VHASPPFLEEVLEHPLELTESNSLKRGPGQVPTSKASPLLSRDLLRDKAVREAKPQKAGEPNRRRRGGFPVLKVFF